MAVWGGRDRQECRACEGSFLTPTPPSTPASDKGYREQFYALCEDAMARRRAMFYDSAGL